MAAPAKEADGTVALDHRVQAAIQGFAGTVSLYARNLRLASAMTFAQTRPSRLPARFKLPIMVELFAEANEGKARLESEARVDRSGQGLRHRCAYRAVGGDALPLQDLMHLMIVVSDNTATNLILDRIAEMQSTPAWRSWD